ncbi:MAG: hypothetical protein ACQETE_13175 [Bacteroidota bacterium]
MNKIILLTLLLSVVLAGCDDIVDTSEEQKNADPDAYPTYFEGLEADIVYTADQSLYLIDKATQEARKLPIGSLGDKPTHLRWSKDGQQLYFLLDPGSELNWIYGFDFRDSTLTQIGSKKFNNYEVSPDGQRFAMLQESGWFSSVDESASYLYDWPNDRYWDLAPLVDELVGDSTISEQKVYGIQWIDNQLFRAEFSYLYTDPDTTFSKYGNLVGSYQPTGIQLEQFRYDNYVNVDVHHNADSTYAYFMDWLPDDEERALYFIDVARQDTQMVTSDTDRLNGLRISPQGKYLRYYYDVIDVEILLSHDEFYLYSSTERTAHRVMPEAFDLNSVQFSPSGDQLTCMASFWKDGRQTDYRLFVMNADGSDITKLSDGDEGKLGQVRFRPLIN